MASNPEDDVKRCYSTWGETYYDEYYAAGSAYPPVHRDLIRTLLRESGAKNVLDVGCGPASMLRDLRDLGLDLYGFDLTPEMIGEAKRVMAGHGYPPEHFWEGSVLSASDFESPAANAPKRFDAAICVGVMPHVPEEEDATVLANLHAIVEPGGMVAVEARNALFSLFTVNRYSYEFLERELIRPDESAGTIGAEQVEAVKQELQKHFRMDLPPRRKGKIDEPGYDEILSRVHNPIVLQETFRRTGFRDVRLLFYHFHCFPPLFESRFPEAFRLLSLRMEAHPDDWRGHFMASAFVLVGVKE